MKPNATMLFAPEPATGVPNPVDVHVGGRVCMLRLMLGIKQDALAEMIGATLPEMQKYEFGESRITAEHLLSLSRILNVPASFFF